MKTLPPLRKRLTVMVAAVALALLWAAVYVPREYHRVSWQRLAENAGREELLAANPEGAPSDLLDNVARILVEDVVPPRYDEAEAYLARALPGLPFDAGLWLDLAETRLYRGRWDNAADLLEISSRLHPGYTPRLLQSARLLYLLGEEDRALDAARSAASIDRVAALRTLRELRGAGVPPEVIYAVATSTEYGAEHHIAILRGLRWNTRDVAREIWEQIPAEIKTDPENAPSLLPLFSDPLVPEVVLDLWVAADDSGLAETVVRAGAGGREAVELPWPVRIPEVQSRLPGWQPAPVSLYSGPEWVETEDGRYRPLIPVPRRRSRDDGRQEWTFLRLFLPAANDGLELAVPLRVSPPTLDVSLRVRGGGWGETLPNTAGETGWQTLSVPIQNTDSDQFITLSFMWVQPTLYTQTDRGSIEPGAVSLHRASLPSKAGQP